MRATAACFAPTLIVRAPPSRTQSPRIVALVAIGIAAGFQNRCVIIDQARLKSSGRIASAHRQFTEEWTPAQAWNRIHIRSFWGRLRRKEPLPFPSKSCRFNDFPNRPRWLALALGSPVLVAHRDNRGDNDFAFFRTVAQAREWNRRKSQSSTPTFAFM